MILNGATRLYFIVGDPVAQVRAPEGMSQALQERGLNALVLPVHCASSHLKEFIEASFNMQNCEGLILTIPHKFAALEFCEEMSSRAKQLSAVNVMRKTNAGFYGDMLDGVAFCEAIKSKTGQIKNKRVLLVGAGGAGSAIAMELLNQGVSELALHDEDEKRRDALISKLQGNVTIGSNDPSGFDILCNATPAGMQPNDKPPFLLERITSQMQTGCVITKPLITPFIQSALDKGCRVSTGNDMYASVQELMLEFFVS